MSAKANSKAAPKKSEAKAAAKADAAPGKKSGKGVSALKEAAKGVIPEITGGAELVDPDEAEEQADAAASSRASAGAGDAALAAAQSTGEMSASFKNFRHHPDMENFYRFIYENDLRHEALQIIDVIMVEKQQRRALKTAKAHAH